MIKDINQKTRRGGQTMIFMVLVLSGAILSTTSIVALLTLYEVRHTTDVINSAKAFAAADSGIQCALLAHKGGSDPETTCSSTADPLSASGATYTVKNVGAAGALSTGVSHGIARSLQTIF